MDMGGAPPHTDTLIRPAACRAVSKLDCLKQRASVRSLSLVLLDSLPVLATRPPTRARLTWKPVRWTLALKPTI